MNRRTRDLRGRLLRWYGKNRRDLPWRRTADPYSIWVSEVMLQQTRVATVVPYYERFLARFPDVASLAAADEEEVLALWSGLGYYRRARSMREAAGRIVERHGGEIPADPDALRALPGIGRYTAGAIASVAFALAEPVLDGNVRRVLSRLFAVEAPSEALLEKRLWALASELVSGSRPGDLNQSLMELGAEICTPTRPGCADCPVRGSCRAVAEGRVEGFPVAKKRRRVETVHASVAVVRHAGRVLLERSHEDSPLRGSWDLPAVALVEGLDPRVAAARILAERYDLKVVPGPTHGPVDHGILHRRWRILAVECGWRSGSVAVRSDLRWVEPSGLRGTAVSGATHKVVGLLR